MTDMTALRIQYDEACEMTVLWNDRYNAAFDIADAKTRKKQMKEADRNQKAWRKERDRLWGLIAEAPFAD